MKQRELCTTSMDDFYNLLQEIWFVPKKSRDAFQDDGKTGTMIERDHLVTVRQKIGRGKNNRKKIFQYRVHAMFDKLSKKWWTSLYKNKIWIKYQAPEKDNKDEMVKSNSTQMRENNKTNENS